MAVQYAPTKLRVPPGFQNLLEGLAREVLREQPDDIIVFAAKYFQHRLVVREEESKEEAKPLDKDEKIDIDLNDPKTNEAAVKIQAGFRGHKTREEIKQKKEEAKAAVKIQSGYRGMKAREQVKELKESKSQELASEKASEKQEDEKKADVQESLDAAAEKPAEKADVADINLSDPEVQDAALKIQASFRGYKAREEVKTLKSQPSHSGPAESEPEKKGDEVQGEQETTATAEGSEDAKPSGVAEANEVAGEIDAQPPADASEGESRQDPAGGEEQEAKTDLSEQQDVEEKTEKQRDAESSSQEQKGEGEESVKKEDDKTVIQEPAAEEESAKTKQDD